MTLKKIISYLLILVVSFSPLQLIAKTNQNLAQLEMSIMMSDGSMSTDCEHCSLDGKTMMNCSFPSASIYELSLLSNKTPFLQSSSRLAHHKISSQLSFIYPDLFIKPPINTL